MTKDDDLRHINDFKTSFYSANIAICKVSPEGLFLDVNPEMETLFGYSRKEFLSKEIKDVTHPEDISLSYNKIESSKKSINKKLRLSKRYIHKKGNTIYAEVSSTLISDSDGTPLFFLTYINDVTSHKKTERELEKARKIAEEKELQYRMIAENTSDGIFVSNNKGEIVYVSESYLNQLGYSRNEEIGRAPDNIYEIIHPDDRDILFRNIYHAIENKERSYKYVYRVRHKGGHYIWREDNARFQYNHDGNHVQSIVICRDISAQKNREHQIETQLIFSEALNAISELIISIDDSEKILDGTNRIIAETLNLDRALIYHVSFENNMIYGLTEWIREGHESIEMTKNNYSLDLYKTPFTRIFSSKKYLISHYDDIDPAFLKEKSDRLLHGKYNIKSLLWYPFAFKEQEYHVFTLNQVLEKRIWSEEEIQFVDSVARQVNIALIKIELLKEKSDYEAALEKSNSSLKAAIIKAQENEELVSKLIATVPDIILRTNLDGDIIFINEALSKTFPFLKKDDVLGMNMRRFISEEDKQRIEENTKLMFKKPLGIQEYKMHAGGNTIYNISVNGDVLRDALGWPQGMVYVLRDITQVKEKEKKLTIALEKAKESDRLKSAFLSNMSHEIRTPMNGILGFTQLLKEPTLSGDEKESYISIIEKSGQRMLDTINDIISISKIESGEDELNLSETNVNDILKEQFEFFNPEASSKGILLSFHSPLLSHESMILTDKRKLESIIINLIKNAIKFTSKGNISFGCRRKKENNTLEFYVQDTGIGIPENRIEAIFNRFEQADIEDSQVFEGSGLGLAISRAYVEMLNGEITVKSKENQGSTFRFFIPYISIDLNEKKSSNHLNSTPTVELNNLTLIIAEDDEISTEYFRSILGNSFKKLIFTKTGRQTIEAFQNNPETDIILMDIKMPDINGYDATRKIREINKGVIIIAQTAFGLEEDESKAFDAGCNGYIAKPIKREDLLTLISQLQQQK